MSRDMLDTVSKVVATVFYVVVISVTIYGQVLPYLDDFWKGFMLGALVIFFSMVGFNFYQARTKSRLPHQTSATVPIEKKSKPSVGVPQKAKHVDGILGGQQVLTQLKYFKAIWEQHGGSEIESKWRPQYTEDMEMLPKSLRNLTAAYKLDFELAHQVRLISDELERLASTCKHSKYSEAIVHGNTAYGLVATLVSFLESEPNSATR